MARSCEVALRLVKTLPSRFLMLGANKPSQGCECKENEMPYGSAATFARCALVLPALLTAGCITAPDGDAPSSEPINFICDRNESVSITFTRETAVLTTDDLKVRMVAQPAASGLAYSGEGQSIRGKGQELTWTKADGTSRSCRDQASEMDKPDALPLSGITATKWLLVSFQSSDDATGTSAPPRPENYTLSFERDGRLSAQLDCNRGAGRWRASSPSDSGGNMSIQGVAMTRAMCGAGAMDTRIAADLDRVRTFTIRDGRLYLALEADAGIYEFRPDGN